MKKYVFKNLKNLKTYLTYNNKKNIITKNNFKTFIYFLKIILLLICEIKKNKKELLDIIKFHLFFSNIYDFSVIFLNINKKYFFFFKYFYYKTFIIKMTEKRDRRYIYHIIKLIKLNIKSFNIIKKRFYLFKYLTKYSAYWTTSIQRTGKICFTDKKNFQPVRNIWPIFEISDEVTRYRLGIDDGIGNSWLFFTVYQVVGINKSKSLLYSLTKNLYKADETESGEVKFKAIEKKKDERVINFYKIKEKSAIKVKKRQDAIIELQESIYNRVVLKKIHYNFLNTNKLITINNITTQFNFCLFFIKFTFYILTRGETPNARFIYTNSKRFKYKLLFIFKKKLKYYINYFKYTFKKKNIFPHKKRKYRYKKKIYKRAICQILKNSDNFFLFQNIVLKKPKYLKFKKFFKKITNIPTFSKYIKIVDYKKILDLKYHFLNMYYLCKKTPISQKRVFFFTSPSLIFNMNFFYQYQFEKWIVNLIFLKINGLKWFKVYFSQTLNMGKNVFLFFNLKYFHRLNIIKPTLYTSKVYKILIIKSKINKLKDTLNLLSKIILRYFFKLFYSSYSIIFTKFNLKLITQNARNYLFDLEKSVRFELIRANFIFEFLNVCAATFFTYDPKFLLKWVVKVLQKINFKKHWKFLYLLKYNILKISKKFIQQTDFLGFHMIIKGKIGALGSVRKKTLHIRCGQYGFSRYYISGDTLYLTALTETGKIGLRMITAHK